LSHTPSFFKDMVSCFVQALDCDPPIYTHSCN
jgi:hypothetical protein